MKVFERVNHLGTFAPCILVATHHDDLACPAQGTSYISVYFNEHRREQITKNQAELRFAEFDAGEEEQDVVCKGPGLTQPLTKSNQLNAHLGSHNL